MGRTNNVDVARISQTLDAARKDPSVLRKTNKVVGVWNLNEAEPQFSSVMKFENGEVKVEADQPTPQGGKGMRPGPVLYCLYGTAACFSATFATLASIEGMKLHELRIEVENDVDFGATFGLSQDPIIKEVRIKLAVKSDAPNEKVAELVRKTEDACPASYCLKNPIPVKVSLER